MAGAESRIRINIREMEVDDIPEVYHLGNQLFRGPGYTTLYRTWDAYEITTSFNQDPELCLVAEDANEEVVGFALGTTYEKEKGAWMYGHVEWLGVKPEYQRSRVGRKLLEEMERRMREQGVRMVIMDTATTNTRAIRFFESLGYGKPHHQVWMSKVLRRRAAPSQPRRKASRAGQDKTRSPVLPEVGNRGAYPEPDNPPAPPPVRAAPEKMRNEDREGADRGVPAHQPGPLPASTSSGGLYRPGSRRD